MLYFRYVVKIDYIESCLLGGFFYARVVVMACASCERRRKEMRKKMRQLWQAAKEAKGKASQKLLGNSAKQSGK